MGRALSSLAALALFAVLVPLAACGRAGAPFVEVPYDPSRLPPRDVAMPAGQYRLELLATTGTRRGSRAEGSLTLHPACDSDRSPQTGEGPRPPRPGSDPRYGMWGYADIDWASVAAPVEHGAEFPSPTSDDPIYPGALGATTEVGGHRVQRLLIGTRTTRGRRLSLDGLGVELRIEQVVGDQFFGVWTHYGIGLNGSGTFWASLTERSARCRSLPLE